MANVTESASRIKAVLLAQGSLNLWEARAILNESRDTIFQALLWMASRKEIVYCLKDQELYVTLARGEGSDSWQKPSSAPLEGLATHSASRAG